jgi:hypothetical protein
MKPRRSVMSMLDASVRWTGMPERVAAQMSNDSSVDRHQRPLRWVPVWPIAFSCALLMISLAWPPALDGVPPGGIIAVIVAFWGAIFAMVPAIHANGPLAKPSLDDDEREAALRKDSRLFCLGLLAVLNVLGQPLLLILSHWQDWQIAQIASVVTSAFMLNATLLGCLPTLYASWNLPRLSKE